MKIDCYVEDRFLVNFRKKQDETKNKSNWYGLYEFLTKSNHINLFDSSGHKINNYDLNRLYFDQYKQPKTIPQDSEQKNINFSELKNPFTLTFSSKEKNFIVKNENKYGIKIVGYQEWENDWERISKSKILSVNQNFKWHDIERTKHPCKYIILIDQYILSINKAQIQNNYVTLLEKLIRNKDYELLSVLLIFTEGMDNQKTNLEEFNTLMDNLKKKYNFSFLLLSFKNRFKEIPKVFHDRQIFTNYFQYASQNSFHFFKDYEKCIADSQIDVNPLIDCAAFENMKSRMNKYFTTIKSYENNNNLTKRGDIDILNIFYNLFLDL